MSFGKELQTSRRNARTQFTPLFLEHLDPEMEATGFPETSISTCKTTKCHVLRETYGHHHIHNISSVPGARFDAVG